MKGSCLCGKCVFELKGNISAVGKCHCTKCRKVSGTGSNAVFWARPGNVEWISGSENTKTFSMSDGWGAVFCKDCGSPLPKFIQDRMWIVPAGLMDEDAKVGIRAHIWVENKPHWEIIGDEAPQFSQVPAE